MIRHLSQTLQLPGVSLEDCELRSFRVVAPHRLSVCFLDGLACEVDFSSYGREGGPLRRALCDPGFFSQAYLAYGVLSWPNGYDIAPETLRRYAEQGFAC